MAAVGSVYGAFEGDELARDNLRKIAVLRRLKQLIPVHVDLAPLAGPIYGLPKPTEAPCTLEGPPAIENRQLEIGRGEGSIPERLDHDRCRRLESLPYLIRFLVMPYYEIAAHQK